MTLHCFGTTKAPSCWKRMAPSSAASGQNMPTASAAAAAASLLTVRQLWVAVWPWPTAPAGEMVANFFTMPLVQGQLFLTFWAIVVNLQE